MHNNYNDKYHRVIKFDSTGIVNAKQLPSLNCRDKDMYLSTENTLRIFIENVGPTSVIEIQGKLITQKTWTSLGNVTGAGTEVFDISTWDQIQYNVISLDLDGNPEGCINASGFVSQLQSEINVDNINIESDLECAETPIITNTDILATSTVHSVLLNNGTKKITFRHRGIGNLEFSFSPGFSSYITVRKGNVFTENDLCLQGVTLYFRSDKVGVLELIEWL